MTDPDPLDAEVKREMVAHSRRAVLMVDGSKLHDSGLSVVADLSGIALLLAVDPPGDALRALPTGETEVRVV